MLLAISRSKGQLSPLSLRPCREQSICPLPTLSTDICKDTSEHGKHQAYRFTRVRLPHSLRTIQHPEDIGPALRLTRDLSVRGLYT